MPERACHNTHVLNPTTIIPLPILPLIPDHPPNRITSLEQDHMTPLRRPVRLLHEQGIRSDPAHFRYNAVIARELSRPDEVLERFGAVGACEVGLEGEGVEGDDGVGGAGFGVPTWTYR